MNSTTEQMLREQLAWRERELAGARESLALWQERVDQESAAIGRLVHEIAEIRADLPVSAEVSS